MAQIKYAGNLASGTFELVEEDKKSPNEPKKQKPDTDKPKLIFSKEDLELLQVLEEYK